MHRRRRSWCIGVKKGIRDRQDKGKGKGVVETVDEEGKSIIRKRLEGGLDGRERFRKRERSNWEGNYEEKNIFVINERYMGEARTENIEQIRERGVKWKRKGIRETRGRGLRGEIRASKGDEIFFYITGYYGMKRKENYKRNNNQR